MTENKVTAIIMFVDIRGFTKWSENIEVFQHSSEFISDFYKEIQKSFNNWYLKPLGDGMLLVKEIITVDFYEISCKEIVDILNTIEDLNEKFNNICDLYSKRMGQKTDLHLGWGITRGTINKINNVLEKETDYIGSNINKAARLCDVARPYGIAIDKGDFADIPAGYNLFSQTRKLESINEIVNVWVSANIYNTFITREKLRENPEVHIAGICINNKQEILLSRRNSNRALYPGLYEGCGGQLKYSEGFKEGVTRHYRTEMNISVSVLDIYTLYDINIPNHPHIPGIVFLCQHIEGIPESANHSETKWIPINELKIIPDNEFIPNLKNEIESLLKRFNVN